MGMLTGMWLRSKRTPRIKCAGMLGAGILCTLLGRLWSPWFPINKNLWTSSYVLFTAGVALMAWALCYWMAEIKSWTTGWKRGWTFFWVVFGMNAITAYVFSELLAAAIWETPVYGRKTLSQIIAPRLYGSLHRPQVAALVYALCFVLVCWLPMLWLYRKKIFIKV
jgi:predicted acyltransferase